MWPKDDASTDDLEGVARRLREERPQATPLELDRIKLTAMSRARGVPIRRMNGRRFAVGALTVGMLAAGAGGVIASGGNGNDVGNAASAQYSGCATPGNQGGSAAGFDCSSESTTSPTTTTTTTTNITSYVTITYTTTAGAGSNGVLGSKNSLAHTSRRHFFAHFFALKGGKLKKLLVIVNGKVLKTLSGRTNAVNLDFVGFPCSSIKQVVVLEGVLTNGRKITETRRYNLCR